MPPLTADELAAACAASQPDAIAGFVADLYEARGRTVERGHGPSFTLGGAGDPVRVCVPVDRIVPPDADAVVVAGRTVTDDVDAHEIDARRLRDALCYAVDRSRADSLLERWFGRSLSSFEGSDGTADAVVAALDAWPDIHSPSSSAERPGELVATDRIAGDGVAERVTGGPDPADSSEAADGPSAPSHELADRRTLAVVAGTALVLLVGLSLAGMAVGVSPGFGPGATAADATVPPSDSTVPGDPQGVRSPEENHTGEGASGSGSGTGPVPNAAREPNVTAARLPPGVDEGGVTDYRRLVAAHRSNLDTRSYRVTLLVREYVGGTATGLLSQTVQLENDTHYYATTMRFGEFASAPPTLTDGTVYADGAIRLVRTADGARQEPVSATDPFLDPLTRYLGWYLSVEESWITQTTGSPSTVQLRTAGDPWPGVANATGTVEVTESGLVTRVRRSYDDPDTRARVVVTVSVSGVGETSVAPPRWVRRLRS